jgi:WAS family protein 3
MPLEQRVIEPIYASQGMNDGRKNVYDLLPNELECFSNETLSNVIRQLASLSQMAEDLFGSIAHETQQLLGRTGHLQQRVDTLTERVQRLDSSQEHVSLHELHMRRPYKAIDCTQQAVFGKKTLPVSLQRLYDQCDQPPLLAALDPYRDDGKKSLKFYTDPDFFFELWRDAMLRQVDKERTQKKISQRPDKKPRPPANSNERFRRLASQREFLPDSSNGVPFAHAHPTHVQSSPQLIHHSQQQQQLKAISTSAHAQVSPALYSAAHIAQHEVQFYDQYDTVRRRPNMLQTHQQQQAAIDNGLYGHYSPTTGYAANNGIYGTTIANGHQPYGSSTGTTNGMSVMTNGQYAPPMNGQSAHSIQSQLTHQSLSTSTASMQTLSRRSNSAVRPSQPPPAPPSMNTPINGNSEHATHLHNGNAHLPPQSLASHQSPTAVVHTQHSTPHHMQNGNHSNATLSPSAHQTSNGHANGSSPAHNQNHTRMSNGCDMIDQAAKGSNLACTVNESVLVKSSVPGPPPPPPPPPMLPIVNGNKNDEEKEDNEPPSNGVGLSSLAQEILKKQKQLQPVKRTPRPAPKSDPRNDLLAAIREGIKLRRVEDSKQKEVEKSELVDVASILARRVAMELSESESDDASESSDCWEDDAEC